MSVVIHEFQIEPAPEGEAANAPAPAAAKASAPKPGSRDVERVIEHQTERSLRVWAH